jgi:hypothetical protein
VEHIESTVATYEYDQYNDDDAAALHEVETTIPGRLVVARLDAPSLLER